MPVMHRKPLLDRISEAIGQNFPLIFAILAGAVSILILRLRHQAPRENPRPNRDVPISSVTTNQAPYATVPVLPSNEVVAAFKKHQFRGSKVCVTWEVLGKGDEWNDGAEKFAEYLSTSTQVFFMCRVKDEEEKNCRRNMFRRFASSGLERKRVLFCTTEKGYEAFTRQLIPSLLITHDVAQARFLARVLPYILYVGHESVEAPNVQTISSASILLDN